MHVKVKSSSSLCCLKSEACQSFSKVPANNILLPKTHLLNRRVTIEEETLCGTIQLKALRSEISCSAKHRCSGPNLTDPFMCLSEKESFCISIPPNLHLKDNRAVWPDINGLATL